MIGIVWILWVTVVAALNFLPPKITRSLKFNVGAGISGFALTYILVSHYSH